MPKEKVDHTAAFREATHIHQIFSPSSASLYQYPSSIAAHNLALSYLDLHAQLLQAKKAFNLELASSRPSDDPNP